MELVVVWGSENRTADSGRMADMDTNTKKKNRKKKKNRAPNSSFVYR